MKPPLSIHASVLAVLLCLVCAGASSNDTAMPDQSETAATNGIIHSSQQLDDAWSYLGTGEKLANSGQELSENSKTSSFAPEARLLPDHDLHKSPDTPPEIANPTSSPEKSFSTNDTDRTSKNPAGKRNKKTGRNKNTTTTTTMSNLPDYDDLSLVEIDNDVTEWQHSPLVDTVTTGRATLVDGDTKLFEPIEMNAEPTPNVDLDSEFYDEPQSPDDNKSSLFHDLDEANIDTTTQRFVRANAVALLAHNLVLESPTDVVPEPVDARESTTFVNNKDEMFYDDQPNNQDEYKDMDELLPPSFRCDPTDQCDSSEDLTMSLSSSSGSVVPAGITMILRCVVVTAPEVPAEVTWHAPRRVAHRFYMDEPDARESARRQAAVNSTTERVERTRTGKHPSERLITTSILTVPNATEEDGGAHVCSARLAQRCCHRNGTMSVKIYVPPSYATDLTIVGAVCFVEFLIILYFKTRADRRDDSCSHRGSLANGVHAAQHSYEPLEQQQQQYEKRSKKDLEEI